MNGSAKGNRFYSKKKERKRRSSLYNFHMPNYVSLILLNKKKKERKLL